jgi:response regulator RpfG family c-di-GMP phosphodiesterase
MKKSKGVLLCVDDEIMVLNALKEQLRNEFGKSYYIEIAESAKEGIEVLEEMSQEGFVLMVIISDWLMPGMKGDEFLIEAHKRFPRVIKILLSGQADEKAIQRSVDHANLHEFIAKPWDAQKLVASINSGLLEFSKSEVSD